MTTYPLRTDRIADLLDGVEDLLLDHASDPLLIVGDDELAAIKVFEDIATTAVEDGKGMSVDQFTADVLYQHSVLDATDFVGEQFPGAA